jgi:hypothetical protein
VRNAELRRFADRRASGSRKRAVRQRSSAARQARCLLAKTPSSSAFNKGQVMEIAAAVLFCSVVIWFLGETTDEHI